LDGLCNGKKVRINKQHSNVSNPKDLRGKNQLFASIWCKGGNFLKPKAKYQNGSPLNKKNFKTKTETDSSQDELWN
jgi:hypothetical protein